LGTVVALLAVGLSVVIWMGRRSMMGTRLKITEKESVNYSGEATETEARTLGKALQEIGYFGSEKEKDVLLRKEKGKGTTVSFVVAAVAWKEASHEEAFRTMGRTWPASFRTGR
jgi:hypothetical protein